MRREDLKIIADELLREACRQSAAKYQKPRRGVPTGFGSAVSGDRCQNSRADSGDRGRACRPTRVNHLVARGRKRFRRPTSIFRGSDARAQLPSAGVRGTGTLFRHYGMRGE